MKKLLTLGHGYSARALTSRLLAAGWQVTGLIRDAAKADALEAAGVQPLLWQADDPQPLLAAFEAASHVLHSVTPASEGDPFVALLGARRPDNLEWFGYLSTTGVYGDTKGEWVDETSPLAPARGRSQQRAAAEAAWLATDLPVHLFRLSGIYGPGRGPFQKLRDGSARRIVKQGQVFSRIHVDDIAGALLASMARPRPGAIYNLCDDLPAGADEVLDHAAQLLGVPSPPSEAFETADLSPMARSFYAECRRVRNDLIKRELDFTLQYPNYRAGLAAILKVETESHGFD